MRPAIGPAKAVVVGAYPSAFHVAWTPPPQVDPRESSRRSRPFVASLAVDVEPTVFWDGVEPIPTELLERWKAAVGFDDGKHGSVSSGHNGPSGSGLIDNVLRPLGLDPGAVAFTDAVPWYFVKGGRGSQGEAIRERYGPVAAALGLPAADLPGRPTTRALVGLAVAGGRRESLRREVVESGANLVVTLGQEALDAVRGASEGMSGAQTKLAPSGYGQRGELRIDGTSLESLPLVHPGFERQTRNAGWRSALQEWRSSKPGDA
jgi:hypothetical protein